MLICLAEKNNFFSNDKKGYNIKDLGNVKDLHQQAFVHQE